MDKPHILIVDDEVEILELIKRFLESHGYRCSLAKNGRQMEKAIESSNIDLIVLDLMLPGEDGLVLCRKLRHYSDLPVIMLTAMGDETDRIIGLEMGADDYLAKPFNPRELSARIKAVLRRSQSLPISNQHVEQGVLNFEGWSFDTANRELTSCENVVISLSTAEYELLMAFIEHPHRVLSRDQLLDLARGRESQLFDRSIDTLVSRLRRKLEQDPKAPKIIKTVWGGGYIFTPEISSHAP